LAIAHEAERDGIQFSRYNEWLDMPQGGETASEAHTEIEVPESTSEPSSLA
jgi:hypothetical protein